MLSLERERERERESFLLFIFFSLLVNLQSSVVKISLFCSTLILFNKKMWISGEFF